MSIIYTQNGILVKNATIEKNYRSTLASIAPEFSSSTPYDSGRYVVHDNELRKFTQSHPAGAWSDSDNEAATLDDILEDISSVVTARDGQFPAGSKLDDVPEIIGSMPGAADLSDFDIKAKIGLNTSHFNDWTESKFTVDLSTTFSNKDYFTCSIALIVGSQYNCFYSGIRSKNKEIDFCSYKQMSGNDNFSPKIYFNIRSVEINGANIGLNRLVVQSLKDIYTQRAGSSAPSTITIPSYTENTFSQMVLWGPSYSGGSMRVQNALFSELQIYSRDRKKSCILKPALKISTSEGGILDIVSGRFTPLDMIDLYDA